MLCSTNVILTFEEDGNLVVLQVDERDITTVVVHLDIPMVSKIRGSEL